jgi:hypothetical protein
MTLASDLEDDFPHAIVPPLIRTFRGLGRGRLATV